MKHSLIKNVLRWLPLVTLILVTVFLWTIIVYGGILGITAWYLLQIWLPAASIIVFVSTLIYVIWKRRWKSPAILLTMVIGLLGSLSLVWTFGIVPIKYPASIDHMIPAATIRLPANAPLKVGWGGDNIENNYHAAYPDQRWAYDLMVEPFLSGSNKLSDYGCYGVEVVAPASGLVTVAHDGELDEIPGRVSNNSEQPGGNHVAIKLDDTDSYLYIAHLKLNSITVNVNQRVNEGDVIGQCGNSGNTSEPHIHIHHQRQNPSEWDFGFAEGLPLYFRNHDGEPMPTGGLEKKGGDVIAIGATVRNVE